MLPPSPVDDQKPLINKAVVETTFVKGKKGKGKVSQEIEMADVKKSSTTPAVVSNGAKETQILEYTGTMEMGMAILTSVVIAQTFVGCLWVLNDNEHLIFSDRIAPKFIFDSVKAFITLGFACFWM